MKKTNWIALVCGMALTGLVGTTAVMAATAVTTEVVTKEVSRLVNPASEKLLQAALQKNGVSSELALLLGVKAGTNLTASGLKLLLISALNAPKSAAQQQAALSFMSGLDGYSKTVSVEGSSVLGATATATASRTDMGKVINASSVDADEQTIDAIENREKVLGDLNPVLAKDAKAALAEKGTISGPGMIACQGKIDSKEAGFPTESANNALAITALAKKLGNGCKGLYSAASKTLGISMNEAVARVSTLINKCQIFGGEYAACAVQ